MNDKRIADDYGRITDDARLLPIGGGGNIICSKVSWSQEMVFRKNRIKEGVRFELPSWDSLKKYNQ